NPREGFFRESEFLHPDLRFQLSFPQGWTTNNQKQAVLAVSPNQDALVQLRLAEDVASPDDAARRFFLQDGITLRGPVSGEINGLRAAGGTFFAAVEGGRLAGSVIFVAHGGNVYQLLAYAAATRWSSYELAADRALRSFRPLTDPAALNVQPLRLDVVRLSAAMTLAEFAQRNAGPVSVEALALLNNVAADERLEAGTVVKQVVGRLP
ncbi:MAG: peptidase M48, partial [Gemmatimonadetes bacterium]|nr:peptidase M48 [Gemmatimonadota bacterium]